MKTKKTIESKPWIKPGWNKKRNSEYTWQQLRRLVAKCRTEEEWEATFLELPLDKQWDIFCRYHAPPREIKAESGISVILNIRGLDKPKEIQGEIVDPLALTDGDS